MLTLLEQPSLNERALAQVWQEYQTGIVIATITLAKNVARTINSGSAVDLILLFKNGLLLPRIAGASGYSVTGNIVTLGTAAIAGDQFVAQYWYRT